ncbi:beta-ketoacyl synthase N-terminal-like domain-containing protein [Rodentibacter caecimuris]|uniref:Beta-ketoacyl synthase n=1 Tax=Rodentibacter caecimuris TaxID=1796644 RepID=A0ABX3KYM1_9PAST|nr:hypothetical protein BKG89_02835 [Rodentibacter heylii]
MAAYINSSCCLSAKSCQQRRVFQFGQTNELPYFSVFGEPLLNLPALYQLFEAQIEQCITQAGWSKRDLVDIPIFLGSTAYLMSDCEYRFAHQQDLSDDPSITGIGRYLSQKFGSRVFNFATSCTSSAQAIGYAVKMIEQGKYEKILVLGFETFNQFTFEHFQAMGLLAQNTGEKGIVLGEGIGCIALSNQVSDCRIFGVANLTDSCSLTNNSESALARLISKILCQSKCLGTEISAIKPHMVGGSFDEVELLLLEKHFPNRPHFLPKKQLGHTLGASGVLEIGWLMEHLHKNELEQSMLVLNYFLGFAGSNIGWILQWK